MSVIANLTQNTTPETHLQRDVSSVLATYNPDLYPMDTFLRQVSQREKAAAVKVEYESISTIDRKIVLNGAHNTASNTAVRILTIDASSVPKVDDLIFNPANLSQAIMRVTAVTSSTSITVQSIASDAVAETPTMADNTVLAVFANAKADGADASTSRINMPDMNYNYAQIFDALVKVSLTRKATKNYTKQDWDRARQEQLGEFRRSVNNAMIFGKRNELVVAGEKVWTMGGVASHITQTLNYTIADGIDEYDILDWLGAVFNGNNGSKTRILLADSKLSTEIQKSQIQKNRNLQTVSVAGVRCVKMEFNEGTLLLKHCRDFNEIGLEHWGMIVDMKQIKKKELLPLERVPLALKGQGKLMDAEWYYEQCSIEVRNPSTHAIVAGL
jgi:hypothetical protein